MKSGKIRLSKNGNHFQFLEALSDGAVPPIRVRRYHSVKNLLYLPNPYQIKKNAKQLAIFVISILRPLQIICIDIRPQMVVPGIHAGYIFGAGISSVTEIIYSPFVFKMGGEKTATVVYSSLTCFYSEGEVYAQTWYHTLRCVALLFADNCFMPGAVVVTSTLRWGRNKMNKTRSRHITPGLAVSSSPTRNRAYVGYTVFFPANACLGLDIVMTNALYFTYRYNFDHVAFSDSGFPVLFKPKS